MFVFHYRPRQRRVDDTRRMELRNRYDDTTPESVPLSFPGMSKELISAMNEWRLRQSPPLEPNEAVIALLHLALVAEDVIVPEAKQPPEPDMALENLARQFQAAIHSRPKR